MKRNGRLIALVIALTMLFSSTIALAADGDIYDLNTKQFLYKANAPIMNSKLGNKLIMGSKDYGYELNDKVYGVKDLIDVFTEDNENYKELLQDSTPVFPLDGEEELEVVEVSAITTQVAKADKQQLEMAVNEDMKVVTVAELKEAGYTVEFLFNKDFTANSDEKTKGIVNGTNIGDFKYAVKVTPAEGDAITSAWTTVKVVDPAVAVEITEFGLDNELSYVALGDANVKIEATKALNGLGKEITESLPDVEKATSDNIAVAYYDTTNGIQAVKAGIVTFTVKFEGIEETYPLTVEVKEARKATSIANENIKIEASSTTKLPVIKVLDQYGEEFTVSDTLDIKVTNSKGEEVNPDASSEYDLSTEDIYTVEVSLGDTKLGSFTIETVSVADAEIDEYKLVFADPEVTELDVNPLLDPKENTLDIAIEAYIKGVKQTLSDYSGLKVVSSDEDIASLGDITDGEVTVTGKAAGTVTITLYTVEGDLETPVAELDVTVNNTTPQITNLSLAAGVEKLGVKKESDTWEVNDISQLISTDVDQFTEEMIDSIIFSPVDGKAILTLTSEFGGASFEFAAEEK